MNHLQSTIRIHLCTYGHHWVTPLFLKQVGQQVLGILTAVSTAVLDVVVQILVGELAVGKH